MTTSAGGGTSWAERDEADPLALDEYRPGESAVLADEERWPELSVEERARLAAWRSHPDAPRWTHATGDRLRPGDAERVASALPTDGWLESHLEVARGLVHYRRLSGLRELADFPPVSRADLMSDVSAFVPLDADLSGAVHGSSSGSTGAALVVPDDIDDNARTFHTLRRLVQAHAGPWEPDPHRVALAHVVHQREAFTYVSLITSFERTPMMRINLDPADWPEPGSRGRYLAAANPQVITGDPMSLETLLDDEVGRGLAPLAIASGAVELSDGLRAALEARFACPVLDIYGLHETRPLAYRADSGPFRVLPGRIVVETLDHRGAPVAQGEVGEITVTVGQNPFLPLVRYRTGDFGALVDLPGGGVGIDHFEGRAHTVFTGPGGAAVPAVDLTQHLQAHGALGWEVVQRADGAVRARIAGGDAEAIRAALVAMVGERVTVERVATVRELGVGKPRRYRSEAAPVQRRSRSEETAKPAEMEGDGV